ncbi:unnamed protein product [Chilo suppressalis]|uniref:RIIa domain-containing protein n=1 Tax=Chilo suppressalis TaxID=168631 RepID=A0ABN8B0T3_CHISP|nr:unnamed protein product [Chilo suppressalis]
MNELLQQHGCSNVFSIPEGLKELMCDISREVLREQPENIFDFIANYLSVLLITREHGVLAMKILEDLCDCKPTVSEHLMQLGIERQQAEELAQVIKEEIEGFEHGPGKEKLREAQIVKKALNKVVLDEDMMARVCQVARNAYRDYWYRKELLEKSMKVEPDEPWEIAAQHTLELYKRTKPSFGELTRATVKIQAAYRGYYIRRNLLNHLKPKPQKNRPKVDNIGPPVDIAGSREIELGPVIDVNIHEDDVNAMFDEYTSQKLGLHYDPMKTITHVEDVEHLYENPTAPRSSRMLGQVPLSTKTLTDGKTRQSQVDDIGDGRRYPKSVTESARQSRQLSRESMGQSHNASIASVHSTGYSMQKISFLEAPPEVIPDVFEYEIDDTQPAQATIAEDQEDPGAELVAEVIETEQVHEVPEELPTDAQSELEDSASAPTASVPSSTPATADNTDVEDAADPLDATGDEEED